MQVLNRIDPARCFQCGENHVLFHIDDHVHQRADSPGEFVVSRDAPDADKEHEALNLKSIYDGTKTPPLCSAACLMKWHRFGYMTWCQFGQMFPLYEILAAAAKFEAACPTLANS